MNTSWCVEYWDDVNSLWHVGLVTQDVEAAQQVAAWLEGIGWHSRVDARQIADAKGDAPVEGRGGRGERRNPSCSEPIAARSKAIDTRSERTRRTAIGSEISTSC